MMKKFVFLLFILLIIVSCQKVNLNDDIKSVNALQLNSIQKVIITRDNGLLIAGVYDSKITFIRTDANFNIIWRKDNYEWGNMISGSWGSSSYLVNVLNIFQNEFDNFVFVGSIEQGGCVLYSSVMIAELGSKGEELKKAEFKDVLVYDAIKTVDGGYLLSGTKLQKFDKDLKINWEKNYWSQNLMPGKVINTYDGRYALTIWNFNDESFLKVLDAYGNETLSEEYSFNDIPFNENGNDLIQLKDRGFLIVGRTRNVREPSDMDNGVLRVNESGKRIWTRKSGKITDEWLQKIIYSSDKELIVQGQMGYPGDISQKSFILRMDLNGQVSDSCSFDINETLLYSSHDYFVRVKKDGDTQVRIDKIPFGEIFTSAAYSSSHCAFAPLSRYYLSLNSLILYPKFGSPFSSPADSVYTPSLNCHTSFSPSAVLLQ
jgi:hypothetical protein